MQDLGWSVGRRRSRSRARQDASGRPSRSTATAGRQTLRRRTEPRPRRRPVPASRGGTRLDYRGLERLLDLAGLEAARADVGARRLALEQDADALEVRL